MEENLKEINIINQKEFILKSEGGIEYYLNLFISNNDLLCIDINSINNYPNKKYSLSMTMNELIKNRFFKIFFDLDEVFRELEKKIEKSTIIEDTNLIYLDIPIGLIVINDIILKINETEKSKEDSIKDLLNELKKKDNKIDELENKIKENEINFNLLNDKLNNEIQTLNQTIKKNKEELEFKNLIIESTYENIIEIEIETNEDNKEIKIINNNIFKKENTNLLINQKKTNFNNFINFIHKGNYKLLILNNDKLENLKDMFYECKELKKINFIKFNQNINSMNSMFSGCKSLTSINVSKFNTNNVKSMNSMFYDCKSLTSIDVSKFNTQNVNSMDCMFSRCENLTSIDVSKFNIKNINSMDYMFDGCKSLISIDVSNDNFELFKGIVDENLLNKK